MTTPTAFEVMHRMADAQSKLVAAKVMGQVMLRGSCLVRHWVDDMGVMRATIVEEPHQPLPEPPNE